MYTNNNAKHPILGKVVQCLLYDDMHIPSTMVDDNTSNGVAKFCFGMS